MRAFFKTCKVHHCFSQELFEPRPSRCRCRKMISREFAAKLVADGVGDWLVVYPSGNATTDIVLKGRAGKTPRAQTIEKAHMERYAERLYSQVPDMDDPEVMQLFEIYHDIEIESRLKLFKDIGLELVSHKHFSDGHGHIVGEAARVLVTKIIAQADAMKISAAIDDPFRGEAIFNSVGKDQRTCIGKNVSKDEIVLDKTL